MSAILIPVTTAGLALGICLGCCYKGVRSWCCRKLSKQITSRKADFLVECAALESQLPVNVDYIRVDVESTAKKEKDTDFLQCTPLEYHNGYEKQQQAFKIEHELLSGFDNGLA